MYHLFIRYTESGSSHDCTMQVLNAVRDNMKKLVDIGVKLTIHKVTNTMVSDPEIKKELSNRGVSQLPTLINDFNSDVVVGVVRP